MLEKNFNHATLFEEEFLLAMPAAHPLATLKEIKSKHLDNEKSLLLEEGHCMRDQALSVCHLMQALELQSFRATSLETLRHMVIAGVGITLMPKLACHVHEAINYVPFDEPKPSRTIGFYWRANSAKQIVFDAILKDIKLILKQHKTLKII